MSHSLQKFLNFFQHYENFLFPFSIYVKGFLLLFLISFGIKMLLIKNGNHFNPLKNTSDFIFNVTREFIFKR